MPSHLTQKIQLKTRCDRELQFLSCDERTLFGVQPAIMDNQFTNEHATCNAPSEQEQTIFKHRVDLKYGFFNPTIIHCLLHHARHIADCFQVLRSPPERHQNAMLFQPAKPFKDTTQQIGFCSSYPTWKNDYIRTEDYWMLSYGINSGDSALTIRIVEHHCAVSVHPADIFLTHNGTGRRI